MKIKSLLLLGLLATGFPLSSRADGTQNVTFLAKLSGNGDWTPAYFPLDRAQIAQDLNIPVDSLLAWGGSKVTVYSVKEDGSVVPPNAKYASADGNDGDWHDAKGHSLGGWTGASSFYHVVNYKDFTVGIGQNPNAGLAYGDAFRFRLLVRYTPMTGNVATETVNVSYKIYQEVADEKVDSVLNSALLLCKSDTATKSRQVYYNKQEMETAFAAAAAGEDITQKRKAIAMLQQAHENFWIITDAYEGMMKAVGVLRQEVEQSDFILKESINELYNQARKYYQQNEDHTAWMTEQLTVVREMSNALALRFKVGCAVRIARVQLAETNYTGKEALLQAVKETENALATANNSAAFQKLIDNLNAAQAAYLANRTEQWVTIKNGNAWVATNTGRSVQAHGPGFLREGDVWYMCGEDRTAAPSAPWTPDVNLYSSTDLVNWKFERKIIENGVTAPELGHGRFIERPKLLYNAKTGKYLVWCHYEQGNYGASEAACFECDSVNGAYKKIWSGRPANTKSRDCNVFQDSDGTAYFISTTDENSNLGLFRLSDDYHSAVEKTVLFARQGREAPAIVRVGDRYFMFNSACSGWEPNQCKMSYSTSLESGWTGLVNVGNYYAYDTQAAAILTIKGTKKTTYLYVGDRWQDPGLSDTKTIIFPVSFNGGTANLDFRERFDINFVTGEWRETPTEGMFVDRSNWKVKAKSSEHASYPATNAIDGNMNSFWRSASEYDSNTSVNQSITIDMGRSYQIKGLVIMPRLDYSAGLIRSCMIQTSKNGVTWSTVYKNTWLPYGAEVNFAPQNCRYFRITKYNGGTASIAEINAVLADETTGIEHVMPNKGCKTIMATKYYTPDGRQVTTPGKGLFLERVVYTDGTSKTVKRIF